ncbi:MAG: DUF2062 domain-containing protein [Betaproteobacteria bacterium]|nr:DUF2062 domain-containing protein [Betaproteobacteria bacterium]
MPRKLFRKYLPTHQSIRENRYLRFFGAALQHHDLWHLHRRSVAGGVAIGMFCGLVPGPLQMLSAALCAIVFRVNLPVAAIVTWYTNPVTILPLYYVAYKLGLFVTGSHSAAPPQLDLQLFDLPIMEWIPAVAHWFASMGKPFAAGLVLLALILAVAGYLLVIAAWRVHVVLSWRKRRRSRAPPTQR